MRILLQRGFTLVELLAVIFIISILMALLFPAMKSVIPRAQEVVCMSHLRRLWLGFAPSVTDGTGWPQVPASIPIGSQAEQQWWIDTSSNLFNIPPSDWRCPTVTAHVGLPNAANPSNTIPLIDYMPTLFDAFPMTPNKWPNMPWFMEISNAHGKGNLMIRPDGSIMPAPGFQTAPLAR
ncbi:MAG: type II secretion system GspH family protein [Verrucomicrobia bacterium]|nr:type II secretion system GspH family protein [Verrucomicrobiota bacterium]